MENVMAEHKEVHLDDIYTLLHASGTYKNSRLHYHDAYELVILENGERSYMVGDKLVYLKPRDVLIIKPNEIHGAIGGKYTLTNFAFNDAYFSRYFSKGGTSHIVKCFEKRLIRVREGDFGSLLKYSERLCEDTEDVYALMNIMCILESNLSRKTNDLSFGTKISAVLEYINENYAAIESLSDICNSLYISKQYLCDLFKEHTGTTVMKYIVSIRIRASLELLSKTNLSIEEISEKCGFNSSSYFTKVFKNITGVSPAKYRRLKVIDRSDSLPW